MEIHWIPSSSNEARCLALKFRGTIADCKFDMVQPNQSIAWPTALFRRAFAVESERDPEKYSACNAAFQVNKSSFQDGNVS